MPILTSDLKDFLEQMHDRYNRPDFVQSDPISIPHRFSSTEDIAIAALLSATIAWGQRPTIIRNANRMLELMDNAPHEFIVNHQPSDRERFTGFVHRTFNGEDLAFFVEGLQHIYKEHGSLQASFIPTHTQSFGAFDAITSFRHCFFSIPHPKRTAKHVSDPGKGSSAKRLNMFLRWMVRDDKRGVDFGIWKSIPASALMLPLDVHTGNVSRKLGLLTRKQNDWKSVAEVTESLRRFDPLDPVKYDFALFGLGAYEQF